MNITPQSDLKVTQTLIPAWKQIPNTSIQGKPLLIYHTVFDPSSLSLAQIRDHLKKIGAVQPEWTYSMYPTSHYHSTTHEVLCVVEGEARICFGHELNPQRVEVTISKGDLIIIPAGVSHRLLEDFTGDFTMLGSYPPSTKHWDMCYGNEDIHKTTAIIEKLPWFEKDPVYGQTGPVLNL
ncbi:hypothetical protein FQN57_004431 [Myotisia sp. PD_48]|nr:hypothetical protein FQN57_004431 [Myotisia sp. PD_48]